MSALPADTGDEAARAEIRAQVRAAGTSFYWAMRFLPAERREAMFAVYAYCRVIDDIADSDDPPLQKRAALAEWRAEVDRIYDGTPRLPLSRVLAQVARRYELRRVDFLRLIDGMEMDAGEAIRAPSLEELDLYCDRVASAVGRLSVRIFGDDGADADRVAWALGRALQLTNILRDLVEDAGRGRLYLPRELLVRHGITVTEPALVLADPRVTQVCADLANTAEARFAEATRAMTHCKRGTMRPAAMMAAVYRASLARLRKRGWSRLDEPAPVPRFTKIWLALRHGLL
ncbi:MAG TPA: presqualene diphosphate synthase HpnD [Stellaceae bacterium]|nr:presqualene diphosphate synthase HpnD [Stellaceae bacterium]